MNTKLQIIAGAVSLTALLVYTLVHTGGLLATYVNPWWIGFVAAGGIELAVVSLSLRIGDLKRSGQGFRFFMFVLVSVVIVSALANISQGFAVAHKAEMTLANISQLDAIQAIIGLTATGLISLIVLALSEIIGVDVNAVVKQMEREQRKVEQIERKPNTPTEKMTLVRIKNAEQRRTELLKILKDEPDTTYTSIAKRLNIARTTLYADMDILEKQGLISKNGRGE